LNLPAKVIKDNNEYVKYIYDATGRKLSQEVYSVNNARQKSTDYAGEYFYENDTLKFINHEEGRVVMLDVPEYQYHLKDHLGNVRLTFTTKEETESATATMETANAASEQGKFLYYNEAIKVDFNIFDHTNTGPTYYATRLTGGNTNAKFGLTKTLSVMPGDQVNMQVYAKYVDTNTANWTTALNTFLAMINGASPTPGSIVDGGTAGSIGGGTYPISTINHSAETGTPPKAYLNYIVFNRELTTVLDMGYSRITTNSREYGQDCAHDLLSLSYTVKEPGYMYIYLSNENPTPVEVFFDDFNVTHVKSPIIQVTDLYPYGAVAQTYSREGALENKRLYQGKELVKDLGLEQYDFGPRQYDPWGVFTTTQDPHAENYYDKSPYSWVFGNPVRLTDPTGMDPEDPISIGALLNKAVEAVSTIVDFIFGGGNDGSVESAAAYGEAHNTMQAVGVEAQNMKSEIEGTVSQVPGLNVAFNVMDASQAKTTGETMQHLGKAALNANSIPVVGGGKGGGKTYQTYTKPGPNGEVYSGRTSGKGTPQQNVSNRDAKHHMNSQGYGKATLDKSSTNKAAIRGREQQLIDKNGGAKSQGGTSGNKINGVSPNNPKKQHYTNEAKKEF
jgi:RHS repeat-associated protein